MSKLITYVGHSRVNGELKFRTAGDEKRVFQLEKLGDTDVRMHVLPKAMTKSDAAKWALTAEFFAKETPEVFALFTANVKDENPFAKPAKKPVQKKLPLATVKATNLKVKKSVVKPAEADITMSPKQAAAHRQWWMENVLRPAYEAN